MTRAYSISAETIAQENERVGGDLEKFDVSRVIQLDELKLREMGPRDVHLRVLVVSAEHNVDHAALADQGYRGPHRRKHEASQPLLGAFLNDEGLSLMLLQEPAQREEIPQKADRPESSAQFQRVAHGHAEVLHSVAKLAEHTLTLLELGLRPSERGIQLHFRERNLVS